MSYRATHRLISSGWLKTSSCPSTWAPCRWSFGRPRSSRNQSTGWYFANLQHGISATDETSGTHTRLSPSPPLNNVVVGLRCAPISIWKTWSPPTTRWPTFTTSCSTRTSLKFSEMAPIQVNVVCLCLRKRFFLFESGSYIGSNS